MSEQGRLHLGEAPSRDGVLAAHPGEDPGAFAALGYDAVGLIARAIADAGTTDPIEIRSAPAEVATFQGVTGTVRYPPGQRIPIKSVSIVGVRDGTLALVEERVPDSVPVP